MQASTQPQVSTQQRLGSKLLTWSAGAWLSAILAGQWLFVVYISVFYGLTWATGNTQHWAKVLPTGIVAGEPFGNAMIILHILIPIYVMFAGGLQLITRIRNRFPKFHRINGRMYLITAVVTSVTGIFMIATRGTVGDGIQHMITSFNGLLIILFAYFTYDMAKRRNIAEHQQWALRLFVVVSGVWTFRVMLMFWFMVNGGPVGIDMETFTGPAIKIMSVAQFLLPLILLEVYFSAVKTSNQWAKLSAAGLFALVTVCAAMGIFAVFMGMWLPRISGALELF